jgi:hypothetical protein
MNTGFLITGLILLLIANLLMINSHRGTNEGFVDHFMQNPGPSNKLEPIGAYDNIKVTPNNGSSWRGPLPNEPLLGAEFKSGPDSLFIFKNNQVKPECCDSSYASDTGCVCTTAQQRDFINKRGGNRTVEDGV